MSVTTVSRHSETHAPIAGRVDLKLEELVGSGIWLLQEVTTEKRSGKADEDWPDWYARYMTAEESGEALPS